MLSTSTQCPNRGVKNPLVLFLQTLDCRGTLKKSSKSYFEFTEKNGKEKT